MLSVVTLRQNMVESMYRWQRQLFCNYKWMELSLSRYIADIVESGVKHNEPKPILLFYLILHAFLQILVSPLMPSAMVKCQDVKPIFCLTFIMIIIEVLLKSFHNQFIVVRWVFLFHQACQKSCELLPSLDVRHIS